MSSLPEIGYVRLPQIIGDRKSDPPIPALIPVSRSTWLAGVKSGRFPTPRKLGSRITVWDVRDIRALIQQIADGQAQDAGPLAAKTGQS